MALILIPLVVLACGCISDNDNSVNNTYNSSVMYNTTPYEKDSTLTDEEKNILKKKAKYYINNEIWVAGTRYTPYYRFLNVTSYDSVNETSCYVYCTAKDIYNTDLNRTVEIKLHFVNKKGKWTVEEAYRRG